MDNELRTLALNVSAFFMKGSKWHEAEGNGEESQLYAELSMLANSTALIETDSLYIIMMSLLFMFASTNDRMLEKLKEFTDLAKIEMFEDILERIKDES